MPITPTVGTMIEILHFVVSIPTAIHVLLFKNNVRAAIGWFGLVLLSPLLGSFLYWIFGINRIKARATAAKAEETKSDLFSIQQATHDLGFNKKWQVLMRAGYAIHDAPFLAGNRIKALINGDQAYPRMLEAIAEAKSDILLSSYIFDYDQTGRKFISALGEARKRNISIHVLIDGTILAHKWRKSESELQQIGVTTARFFPFSPRFINLCNHRKILCIDGRVAFLGGMNIRQGNMLKENPSEPVQDIHFEVSGPVIDQIAKVFADDWCFAVGQSQVFSKWNAGCELNAGCERGAVVCRVLPDGPDEHYQKLEWTLIAAINCSESNIRIITPYFIPDYPVIRALQAASLRGVAVEIMVPEKTNFLIFNWAMASYFKELLKFGIKIYQSAQPFDHSKIFLIDDTWSLIGSANWDMRSLALNFEINLECYDSGLNAELTERFYEKKRQSKVVTNTTCDQYPILIQIRNNFFRLFSPYL